MRVKAFIVAAILLMASAACAGQGMMVMAAGPHKYEIDDFGYSLGTPSMQGWASTGAFTVGSGTGHTGSAYYMNYSGTGDTAKTVTCASGTISFWYMTNYTQNTFQIDSATANYLSNTGGTWAYASYSVSSGSHVLKFHTDSALLAVEVIKIPVP